MRTDGVQSSPEAIDEARKVIAERWTPGLRPRRPAHLQDQGQERPGGPRSDPPDLPGPQPVLAAPRGRPGPPVRADLEADDRQPDGERPASSAPPSTSTACRQHAGLRATGQVILFEGYLAVYEEGKDDGAEDEDSARLPHGQATTPPPASTPRGRTSTSPSRRRAIRKPAWSRSWRSWASAGPRPTPRS